MCIFSFISQCFVSTESENRASVSMSSEVKGSQLVDVTFKVASNRCSSVQSLPLVSEAPINHVQSTVLDSEVLSHEPPINHVQSTVLDSEVRSHEPPITHVHSTVLDSEVRSHGNRSKIFEYSELQEATDNFDCSRKLGRGNYGTVYLGILEDGHFVAIKQLHKDRFKTLRLTDEKLQSEELGKFMSEVSKLTSMSHENLVRLYGCTSPQTCELLLVQEYISNGTLANHLPGALAKPGALPWYCRLDIAIQTASALAYLHEAKIIHRDVKTSNILLDDSFNAKVAGYGLSHLIPLDVTHITTDPAGTPGYIDPEYNEQCHLSDKSDVYSFGVVLLELISSMPAFDDEEKHPCLSDLAIDTIRCGQLRSLVDPALGFELDDWVTQTISAVAELAFDCLERHRDMRPSMAEVLDKLKRIKGKRTESGRPWNLHS